MRVKFTDVFLDETKLGHKIQASEYQSFGNYPIIGQGQSQIAGYTNVEDGFFSDVPAIIFGDHTRVIKYVDTPFFLGADGVKVLKSKLLDVDYKYLFYCLQNVKIPDTGYNRHFKWLKVAEIPLPPLDEQRRIAAVLDKVSDLIAKRWEQLDKLDELVKARFVEMFGDPSANSHWSTHKLSELGELNRGISKHRPRNDPKLLGGPYPLIQTGDVSNSGLYIQNYSATYSEFGLAQSRLWKKGTLCITIAANIAQTSILAFDACFPDSVVGFLPGEKTNVVFVHYWFSFFQKILEEQAPQVAQKNINLKILSDLDVIVPPYNLQADFSDFVRQAEKSKLTIQQSLDKLEVLKKALMQQYFGT